MTPPATPTPTLPEVTTAARSRSPAPDAARPLVGAGQRTGYTAGGVDDIFHDAHDAQDPAAREAALMAALPALVAAARALPAGRERLRDVDPAAITSRSALAALPLLRKSEMLAQRQALQPGTADPLGGVSALGWRSLGSPRLAARVYQSPGPVYEPEGEVADFARAARALHAAGFRAGDLVHNSFSYHLTPGAWMMDAGARALGCTVFPGGTGQAEQQLQAMADLQPDGYVGTPSFLRILLEKAEAGHASSGTGPETGAGAAYSAAADGADASSHPSPHPSPHPPPRRAAAGRLRKALLSGEAFPPSLRDWLRERGVDAYQAYATADVGVIAYETAARQGLVVDEGVIVEIVRPGTGEPVPMPAEGQAGEVGEVVVTLLNHDHPLLRWATGDLSSFVAGACPTGRSNLRIAGWQGRADQTTKVRGMFVHPSQVAEVLRRHPAAGRGRLVVGGVMASDTLALQVECTHPADGLAAALAGSLRDVTRLRGEVELVAPGSLPNDGRVIVDARRYD